MKTGDLVTLSAYGRTLDSIPYKYTRFGSPEPIGIILSIRDATYGGKIDCSENEKRQYVIQWANDGPEGRYRYGTYFLRKDLKFVR